MRAIVVLAITALTTLVAAAMASAAQETIENGYNGACLDADTNTMAANGTKVQLWQCNDSLEQQWYVDPVDGALEIRSAYSGRCLDADTNTISHNGTIVQLWDCNGLPQQRWTETGHTIYNALSGRVLDADVNTITQNGTKAQLWTLDSPQQPQQQWFAIGEPAQLSASPTALTIPDGQTGQTTVSWTAPSPAASLVMSVNGDGWQTIAHGASGSEPIAVPQGSTRFAVVWGADPSEQLAHTSVTGSSPDPPLCGLTPSGPPTRVSAWLAGRGNRRPQSATIAYDATATIAGILTSTSGAPMADQPVCVVGNPADSGTRQVYGSTTTDSGGRFSYRVPPGASRWLEVAADTITGPVVHRLRLAVRTRILLRPKPAHLRNHHRLVLLGRVSDPIPAGGVTVLLQVWRSGRWQTFESVSTGSNGRFRGTWLFLNTFGSVNYRMRALVPAQASYPYARTGSRSVTVHVRG